MPRNIFKIYDGRNYFWQWDTNQKLIVLDDSIDKVHFFNKDMEHSIPKDVFVDKDGKHVCYVPDTLLTLPKNLIASAYVTDDNGNMVPRLIKFAVRRRPIPSNYVITEDFVLEDISERLVVVEEIIAGAGSVEKFNTLDEAIAWAQDSQDIGAIISVNIGEEWKPYVVDNDCNIVPICDCNEEELIKDIDALRQLVGDSSVVDQIEKAIFNLNLSDTYDAKGSAAKALDDACEIIRELDNRIEDVEKEIGDKLDDLSFVSYNTQELTDEQKSQARQNIGVSNEQSDWNVNDEANHAHIKNRPFYEEVINTPSTWTFNLDNSGGWVRGTDPDFVKVISENKNITSVMVDSLKIDLIQEREGGVVEDCKYFNMSTETFDGDGIVSYINHLYIRLFVDENGEYTGEYAVGEDGAGWGKCTITANLRSSTIHHLDPKYIKDMYYEEFAELFSVENAEFVDCQYTCETPFAIEVGNTYVVNWDGIEYVCEAYMLDGTPAIGNTSEFGGKGNGEPFCVGYIHFENETFVYSFDDLTTHTFSVSGIIYNTINPKYIKDMYYEKLESNDIVLIDNVVLNVFEDTELGFYRQYTDYYIDFVGTEGQTYFVIWDGVEYECVCQGIVEDFGVGNANIMGSYGSTSNEPFAIHHSSSEDAICVSAKDNGVHTLSIIQRGMSTVVHQIDAKYLPILEEVSEVILEADDVFDETVFEGPKYKKLLGRYAAIVDGISEVIEFIDELDYSWAETDHVYIETWDAIPDWDGGCYIAFPNGNDVSHTVKLICIKQIIKEEYLPVSAAPDWNQNNPYAPNYIANRPFYPMDESYIGSLSFTATGSNTMEYTYETVDDVVLFYFQALAGKGEVIRAKVNGCEGLISVIFSRGYFDINGAMTGYFMFDQGRVWDSTVSMDGISLVSGNVYEVEFYDITTPGYMPIDVKYMPREVHTDERAPIQYGTGDRSTIQNGARESSGRDSHAEGNNTVASGWGAHAEGAYVEATGDHAHAEGYYTIASGYNSHAEGEKTIAASSRQHVQGKYNIEDKDNKYAHIVGNGTKDNDRSNAHTLDWSGNAWFLGDIRIGGTCYDDATSLIPKIKMITMPAADWTGDKNPWSQVINVDGVTANSKVDLQPTAVQIVALQDAEITLMLQNDNGIVSAWAIGNKPNEDYTMDVLITEVIRL